MFTRPFEPFPEPFVGMGVSVELWELVGVRVVVPEDVPLEEVLIRFASGSPSGGWSAE